MISIFIGTGLLARPRFLPTGETPLFSSPECGVSSL